MIWNTIIRALVHWHTVTCSVCSLDTLCNITVKEVNRDTDIRPVDKSVF